MEPLNFVVIQMQITGVPDIRPVITLKQGEIFPSGIDRGRKRTTRKALNLLLEYLHGTAEFRGDADADHRRACLGKGQEGLLIILNGRHGGLG